MNAGGLLAVAVLCGVIGAPCFAQDATIERVLRTQVFDTAFEGFDSYYVVIEEDQPQDDGSREVLATASGKFSDRIQRFKILFLIVGEQIIGGQVLEGTGLPPCQAPPQSRASSL